MLAFSPRLTKQEIHFYPNSVQPANWESRFQEAVLRCPLYNAFLLRCPLYNAFLLFLFYICTVSFFFLFIFFFLLNCPYIDSSPLHTLKTSVNSQVCLLSSGRYTVTGPEPIPQPPDPAHYPNLLWALDLCEPRHPFCSGQPLASVPC